MSHCNTPALISNRLVSPSGVNTRALVFLYRVSIAARSLDGIS